MFCHWHRHVPLEDGWVEAQLQLDPDFAHKAVAYDVVRSAGEKVVPISGKWLRWSRSHIPTKAMPMQRLDGLGRERIWTSMTCWIGLNPFQVKT